ncbi:hypothetical protein T484DRAFT_1817060 [Baffinella frigidus]|nr:hypothetical protein T484DRAFT_1817060 [Cryptophyta sp. CCMP2293]
MARLGSPVRFNLEVEAGSGGRLRNRGGVDGAVLSAQLAAGSAGKRVKALAHNSFMGQVKTRQGPGDDPAPNIAPTTYTEPWPTGGVGVRASHLPRLIGGQRKPLPASEHAGPGPQADKSPSGGLGGVARTEGSQEGVAGGVARIMSPETMGIKVFEQASAISTSKRLNLYDLDQEGYLGVEVSRGPPFLVVNASDILDQIVGYLGVEVSREPPFLVVNASDILDENGLPPGAPGFSGGRVDA